MNRTLRIGIFTVVGVILIVGFSVFVNDHPYWYRPCNEVKIHVDDATGLRRKSPVKTLGLEIGYINSVDLDGERVMVRVCVTGPVRLNADTRAFIRSSGFLGDKFLELKPVERVDGSPSSPAPEAAPPIQPATPAPEEKPEATSWIQQPLDAVEEIEREPAQQQESANEEPITGEILSLLLSRLGTPAFAAEVKQATPTLNASREAELQDTMKKVGKLVDQLTLMVGDLREVTQQREFKETIVNLNQAMKNLELLLRPTGKVMKNVDSAMESLKNTMGDAEAVLKKVREGEGSLGKLVNDPAIYDELRGAIQSINLLLGKAGALKTYVDIAGWNVPAYDGTKARFMVMIAPNPTRYYMLGLTSDPRGRDRQTITTTRTAVNGAFGPTITEVKNVNEEKGLRVTAVFGKYIGPFDFKVGLIEDFGAVGAGIWFDPARRYGLHFEAFVPGKKEGIHVRAIARAQVWSAVYLVAGVDSHRNFTNYEMTPPKIKRPFFAGVGLFFDDDDLKYLLAFR